MAFPYILGLSGYTPAFPTSVMMPDEAINENANGIVVAGEAFTVPAAADAEGRYRLNLDLVPFEQVGVTIVVNGEARILVDYGDAPAAGQAALSMETGVMEFHSSDAGLAGTAAYTGRGTPWMAYQAAKLGKELQATQQLLTFGIERPMVAEATVNLKTAGLQTAGTVPTGQAGDLVAVWLRPIAYSGVTTAPRVGISVGGVTAFQSVRLTGLATGTKFVFGGTGLRPGLTSAAVVQVNVEEAAAGTSATVGVIVRWIRTT